MSTLDNEIFFDNSGLGALPGTSFIGNTPQVISYNTIGAAAGTNGTASYAVTAAFALNGGGGGGGVTQIVAGTNITISPVGGTGVVTINASSTTTSASYAASASVAVSSSYAYSSSVAVSSSYAYTASYVVTAQTASYVLLAQTASYVQTAQTASYVLLAQTASYVLQAVSASFATTAFSSSYALSSSVAVSASYAYSSSVAVSSSYALSSSVAVSSSYARSASVAVSSTTAQTSSYVSGIVNASLLYLGTSGYFASNQTVANPGTSPIATVSTGSYRGVFFDYTVDDGSSNARAGTITVIVFNNAVQYNETTTMDIGDTSDITWDAIISGPDVIIQATTTLFSWNVRYILRSV